MEHPSTLVTNEFVKEEEQEPEIQTDKIPKPMVEEPKAIITAGDYLRERFKQPPFDYSKAPKPFPVRMFPCKRHFTDDSSSDSSDCSDFSDSDSKAVVEEESEIQTEKFIFPKIEAKTAGEYLTERYKYPPFDYSKAPKPFPVRMFPCKRHFTDDSSSDSSDSSDSDSHETIAEEDSKINKENSPAPKEDQTLTEPKEGRLELDFDSDSETQAIQLAKSSTTDLMSGPNLPTSSILIKHGTKRPTEVGDEDSKQAKKMASTKSTDDENEQNWSNLS